MGEAWKPVPDLVGSYEVSSYGRVRSLDRRVYRGHVSALLTGRILRDVQAGKGYRRVTIGGRPRYIHRLVLEAFVGPCPDGMESCHNNGNRADNRLENLRWDTAKGNSADKALHGTDKRPKVECCKRGHEFTLKNTYYRANGSRRCRKCSSRLPQDSKDARNSYMREYRRRTGKVDGLGNQWARRTHCGQGHEFTLENTIQRTDGGRRCRTCRAASEKVASRRTVERRKTPEARAKRNAYLRERRRKNSDS